MSNNVRIAISGRSGCGNTTVTRLLSERFKFKMVNYTFRNIADEKGIEFHEFCKMAETDTSWDRFVDDKQVKLAMEGDSILGSRLAIWMLKEADLKVFLTASSEIRASRIHQREGGVFQDRMKETDERDARDHARYLKLYSIDNNEYGFADLIINTDRMVPEQIVEIISAAIVNILKEKERSETRVS
jgi:CMP/dCMP kinase